MCDCDFSDLRFICRTSHPDYPEDRTASITLVGCSQCERLYEIRQGPEVDRFGTGPTERVAVAIGDVVSRYKISFEKVRELLHSRG